MSKFWIVGTEYKDTQFKEPAAGKSIERIGPFASYEEAEKAWSAKAWNTVDECNARYEIVKE